MENKIVIDATNAPLGRIASFAAKQALFGKSIIILNCNSAIISGRKTSIIDEYKLTRSRGGTSLKGPHFPKNPERIMKRTIRGMLPYKTGRGSAAFKKIMCYNGSPAEYENSDKISLQRTLKIKTLSLQELSEKI